MARTDYVLAVPVADSSVRAATVSLANFVMRVSTVVLYLFGNNVAEIYSVNRYEEFNSNKSNIATKTSTTTTTVINSSNDKY